IRPFGPSRLTNEVHLPAVGFKNRPSKSLSRSTRPRVHSLILVLDNYDSFVHNLARYVRNQGHETVVIRSDQIDAEGCERLNPDAIIVSPGPRRPSNAGCSVDVIQKLGPTIPTLGICLGHQAIGHAFGADIIQVPPMHGLDSPVRHDGRGLFVGCPNPMAAGRYHSLAIDRTSVPVDLVVTADTEDGTVMAVHHREYPIHGLQFHPESVLTSHGELNIMNFLGLARVPQSLA
ncbi:MAG: aminodeoxychorismate/anthranilate synthase component II, partial [Planctomycetota bacterium]